jgi:putative glycosyltransferase (TIGR04372 family)
VRLGTIRSDRIGHFATDACEQKVRVELNKGKRQLDWFWLPTGSSNSQWEKMIRRELPVHDWIKYVDLWNRYLPGGRDHSRPSTYSLSRDVQGICSGGRGGFSFAENEERAAKDWMTKLGWKEGEPFVCALVRDAAYLSQRKDGGSVNLNPNRWKYHDYRDSNIETFQTSLEWLADQGVWIFRMGKIMEKRLNSQHRQIIDYAFLENKSDLLDIWLFANCEFCVSTGTGIDAVSMVYGRPNLYLNAMPLGDLHSFHESTWVPKHLTWQDCGRRLTLKEYLESYFGSSEKFEKAGIEITNLTEHEISDFVKEFYLRYIGTWVDSPEDLELQRQFWATLEEWPDYSRYHGWRHPESRTSTIWLRSQASHFFN